MLPAIKAAAKTILGETGTAELAYGVRFAMAGLRRAGRGRITYGSDVPPDAIRTLSGGAAPVGFGYFDLQPFNTAETQILAQGFPRGPQDAKTFYEAPVGTFSLNKGDDSSFRPFARTRAWCWQQGSRLRWLGGGTQDQALFNDLDGTRAIARIVNSRSGTEDAQLTDALYCLSPDERTGLTINFSRLERLRPGYGYAAAHDAFADDPCPPADGIWQIELATNMRALLLSYEAITALPGAIPATQGMHYLNHLEFSPDGARFVFFHLVADGSHRQGQAVVCGADGNGARVLEDFDRVSHFCWQDATHILLFGRYKAQQSGYFRIDVITGAAGAIAAMPKVDGHPRLIATSGAIVTDTYPNALREQDLYLIDLTTGRRKILASFYAPYSFTGIARCDLHPRSSPSGRYVAVDTPHLGRRAIVLVDLKRLSA